ncbi:hypothetical protein E4U41_005786 [Claviceps citrina]|nr:hypothetical protein E4U41_005786 [Claviceps citrina]
MVIQIFHPFMSEHAGYARHRLQSFSSKDSCPAAVVAASLNHLRRLVFQFQSGNSPITWSVCINPPLVQLADAMLNPRFRNVTDADRRLCFLLCVRAWIHLYRSYPVFDDVVKGFSARALRERLVSGEEARRLLKAVRRQRGHHHEVPEHVVSSSIIIDFNLAEDDSDMARARAIAGQFEDLALQEEFTTGSFDFADEAEEQR